MTEFRNRTYGRRIGKKLRPRQRDMLHSLLPELSIDFDIAGKKPGAHFSAITDEIWLEIGFGGGEHLLEIATRRPEIGFFGCEPFLNGVVKLIAGIEQSGLENIRVMAGDAIDLLDILPVASIGRIYLLYPDPWPKSQHRKRRIITDDNLNAMAKVLKPRGELRFATDIQDYCEWTKKRIEESKYFEFDQHNINTSVPWRNWKPTRYELKAKEAGRNSSYFRFIRK
jgi:tRNA (guanine-N7-)-methyltransferase